MLRLLFPLLIGLAVLAQPIAARAVDDISVDAFFGAWSGNAIAETPPGAFFGYTTRDIDIKIQPKGQGFNLSWLTIMYLEHNADEPEIRRRDASIDFVPTDKPGVFAAVGLSDPHSETGYVWARVEGQTLFVYSMTIDQRGRYNLQVWNRTLTGGGMDLDFLSIQETQPQRSVKGKLVKTAN